MRICEELIFVMKHVNLIIFLGIDQSKAQQLEHLENLKKQLLLKQELINKYKQYNF